MNFGVMIAVATGGAVGSLCRYLVSNKMSQMVVGSFPWGTFSVNVIGSFIMGIIVGLVSEKWQISNEMKSLITIGILGGFTTFSTFSLDIINLIENKLFGVAVGYFTASVLVSVLALALGLYLIKGIA